MINLALDIVNILVPSSQPVDGVSLKPLLQGKMFAERSLFWHYPHYGNQGGEPSSIVRKKNWKLIHYWEDDRNELYDLSTDPYERINVSEQNKKLTAQLNQELRTFLNDAHAKTPVRDTAYDEILARQMYHIK